MNSLVLEGGSFRAIFSAGVMDALLEHEIYLPYCIGASAGISNGVSYISKQPKRNLEVLIKYRNDKRYIGRRNFRKCKSIFGLDFVFDEVPNKLVPFDWDTYKEYTGKVVVVATNARTGKPIYLNGAKLDRKCTYLQATCALPLAFPAIKVRNIPCYDGGLSDPIPIRKAIQDGCKKHIIILTRPEGYVKGINSQTKLVAFFYKANYPKISDLLLTRHIRYNETVQFCEELERQGKAIILRPEHALESFEKNVEVIQDNYSMGYNMALKRMEEIKKFLAEES